MKISMVLRTRRRQTCPAGQTDNGQSFFENPDTGQNRDRQNPDRQTSVGFFTKFQTESGPQTDTGQDFPENSDKNETRTVLSADFWSGHWIF